MAKPEEIQFSRDELRRYGRHLIMPEVGLEGQRKLKAASVLLVGAGGLGSPVALYLAAAGVGRLGIVDFDVVDESNLQRQIIHSTETLHTPKALSARNRILSINPAVKVDTFRIQLISDNALDILREYDVIIDGTDNFPTRYLVNDACVLLGKPYVYGSIFRFEGQVTVFSTAQGPCYRCLYPEPPPPGLVPSCAEGGVLGVLPGIIGTIQATEALKLILGIGHSLAGRLLLLDALKMQFRELAVRKDPRCPVCGDHPTITSLIDYEDFCGISKQQKQDMEQYEISAVDLKHKIDRGEEVELLDVREPYERELASIGGVLIPLSQLPARVNTLDSSREIVVYCHSGFRSARAVEFLVEMGFSKVKNLIGGIDSWSREVDPSVPRY